MSRKPITWIILSFLMLTVLACRFGADVDPTASPTPVPTNTPQATNTPLPPKPVIPYTPVPADMLSPIILQRSPQRGETLSPDGTIEIVFDKPMQAEAVAKAFKVQVAGKETTVEGTLSWQDARTVRFEPAADLPRESVYDVILTQDATADSGEPLREPFTFRFATAGFLDVAQVIPAPDTAEVETDATLTVMFNRPVVALAALQEMANFPAPVTFEPAIVGKGEWLNTSIYVFTPEEPLLGGMTYRATVVAGLHDLSGALLAEAYVWHFTTQPPEVVWATPRDGSTLVDIHTPIQVQFNQPVHADTVKAAFALESAGLLGKSLKGDFAVRGATVIFTPSKSLDYEVQYRVTVAAGVTSVGGGQGMREAFSWNFTTVPLPEIVATTPPNSERNAPPHTAFQIHFNTPIDPDTVMDNLTMTPPLSPTQVYTYFSRYDNTFGLNFGAQPSTEYEVVIRDGIADPYGNTIPKGRTVKFRTAPLDPSYQLRVPDMVGTYDAALPVQVIVGHVNVSRVDMELYAVPLSEVRESYWNWRDALPAGADLLRKWRTNLESAQNQHAYTAVSVMEGNVTLEPGLYFLKVASPDVDRDYYNRDQYHVLVVSDLNLTLKTSPDAAFVWATDLKTGDPVPNLTLKVLSYDQQLLGTMQTDAHGIAQLDNLSRQRGAIVVTSDRPFAAVADEWGRGIQVWDFGVQGGVYDEEYRTYLYTDRPIYRPGQTVYFKGAVRRDEDVTYSLPRVREVMVSIRDAAYEEVYRESLTLSAVGTFDGELGLAEGASLGNYTLFIEFADHYSQQMFQVAAYRPPEFEVVVEAELSEVQRGAEVDATIVARYFFGGPLADTAVAWNVLAERYTFKPPWGGRYSFSDVSDPYLCFDCWWWAPPAPSKAIMSGSGTTDAHGELPLTLNGAELTTALVTQDLHASRITLEATATGPDNQPISGRTSVLVHPGPYYIGLAPQQYVGEAGDESPIDVVAVDWAGERLSDVAIKLEFYCREWKNSFITNSYGGGYWSWETEETLESEMTLTTDDLGEAVAAFIPARGGSYHIVATPANLTAETEAIRSSIFTWVTGKEYVSWRRENNDRITLISDKNSYAVGEIAEILIPSPFEGPHYALITVERAGVRRHEVVRLESNSAVYPLAITAADIPNIYVSVVLVQPRGQKAEGALALADFKMGLLPLDVAVQPVTLNLQLEAAVEQAEPGDAVDYTLRATLPNGEPAAGVELSLDVVDKAVLSLQPRHSTIIQGFYTRRSLQVNTASMLSMSVNRYLKDLAEDLEITLTQDQDAIMADGAVSFSMEGGTAENEAMPMAPGAVMEEALVMKTVEVEMSADRAVNIAPPEGVDVREEFADTAFWSPRIVTDGRGEATVALTLPDNLTTWTLRGVGLNAQTLVGEGTTELMATKPLLVRPVVPRFFVVDDRAQLAVNVSNNTDADLAVEVSLSAAGIGISTDTPPRQTVAIPAHSERKVTWWVTVDDVTEADLIFSATAPKPTGDGNYADASKPRLTTGPDGTLLVFRYTTPDIVGTAGQLTEGGAVIEGVALPPNFDERRGALTVQLDPSLAAGMQDGLDYLEHYAYECTEQTVSRFLPNILTYNALQSLGIENAELAARLPALLDEGLSRLYRQQNPDGGWGWWPRSSDWHSNPHVSAYVVFAMIKAQQTDWPVDVAVLTNGMAYLHSQVQDVGDYKNFRNANRQAWLLYVLAEADAVPDGALDDLFEHREKLSTYARAYLAQALWLDNPNAPRLQTLLSDINNAAILSATGAHWEESNYDWWAMNTDTRSTAIVLDTLTKLDAGNALIPNVVRWLMVARKGGIWETTQETAWSLIALTDWMVETGELDADYDFALYLNDVEQAQGSASRETIRDSITARIPVADLLADMTNALTVARTEGAGRLYYTAHLEVYQPVDEVEPAERGIIVQRRYALADCADEQISKSENLQACADVREVALGDVIRVDLTLIVPHDRYYVVVEDPLPAGGEAIDTGLATTSLLAMDPTLSRNNSRFWWWWHWYSRSELRDEKVVLFADYLRAGTYEYSYTFRATLLGDYHVMPTIAREFYFPEVFGRSDGRLLTIGE